MPRCKSYKEVLVVALLLLFSWLFVSTWLSRSRPAAQCTYGPEVKVIRYLGSHEAIEEVVTPEDQRCVLVGEGDCEGRTDGVVWSGARVAPGHSSYYSWVGLPDHCKMDGWHFWEGSIQWDMCFLARSSLEYRKQIWFALATEVESGQKRFIGDPSFMSMINYAIHYLPNADYPSALRHAPSIQSNLKFKLPPMEAKTKGIMYMSSNCDTSSKRDDLVQRLMLHLDIDSIGNCLHNHDAPLRLRSLEFDKEGRKRRDKWNSTFYDSEAAIMSAYHFRVLIPNSLCDDYIAEKIFNTLSAGVIPIYLGMPNVRDWDPGLVAGLHPAMIFVQDFDSLQELTDFVTALGADTEKARKRRLRYFEFVQSPPDFYPAHRERLMNRTEGLDMRTWLCKRTYRGDPLRHVPVQSSCRGAWFEYFRDLGKDLRKWGCESATYCKLQTSIATRNFFSWLGGSLCCAFLAYM